jgi:hypothetical protein
LAEKYEGIDKSEIATYLDTCLAECESESCRGFADIIKQDNLPSEEANPSPEQLILTIPAIYHEPTILEMKMGLSDNSAQI